MSAEGFVPDAIVLRSLTPLMDEAVEALDRLGADPRTVRQLIEILGTSYAAGLVDGARQAVGEVVVEAERRGLRLMLSPDLQAAHADSSSTP